MDVYDRIDQLLKEKGISRRKAAQMAKIPPTTLNTALYRKRGLSAAAVAELAKVLGASTYDLLGDVPLDDMIKDREDTDVLHQAYKEHTGEDFPDASPEEAAALAKALNDFGGYMNSRPELQGISGKEAFKHLHTEAGKKGLAEYMSTLPDKRDQILTIFDTLNDAGQSEAVKDVGKLAKIPEYQKKE